MFAEIGLLVLEGDAAGLAAKVSELVAARDAVARAGERSNGRPGARRTAIRSTGPARSADRRDAPAPLVHSPHS